ncbi:hypothetical protein ES703_38771 [subsurface metagenome]
MISCFTGGTIVQSLTSREKYEAIKEVIDKAPVFTKFKDRKKLKDAVVNREKMLSTGLGRGGGYCPWYNFSCKKDHHRHGNFRKGY